MKMNIERSLYRHGTGFFPCIVEIHITGNADYYGNHHIIYFITIDKRVIQLYNRLYDRIKGGYGK